MDKDIYNFINKQIKEDIVYEDTCLWCFDKFSIFKLQREIEDKMDINFKQQLCPNCYMRKLMMIRSETSIYKSNCDKCKKSIISMYAPETKEIVYCNNCYNKSDFIIKDDFIPDSKNVEKEFLRLWKKIPKKAIINENNENSEYANFIGNSKNVYLSYLTYTDCENILYSYYTIRSKDCIDCMNIRDSHKCYECINTISSYNCYYCYNIVNSSDLYFSINLESCQNCIFSSNLTNKKYYIFNKPYSKKDYINILNKFKEDLSSNSGLRKLLNNYEKLKKQTVYKNLQKVNTIDSIGNFISDSKKAILSFFTDNIEDSINTYGGNIKNSVNIIGGGEVEYIYNSCMTSYDSQKIIGSFDVFYSYNVVNSIAIYYGKNILFSLGLRNKEYCILNRKYKKEEYLKYSKEIINYLKEKGRFGDFFNPDIYNIPYNDTSAIDFFPIKKLIYKEDNKEKTINKKGKGIVIIEDKEAFISKAVLDLGGSEKINILWRNFEKEVNIPKDINLIETKDLPIQIKDLSKKEELNILKSAIICEKSKRPFRIMKYELEFYKKNNLPLPRIHPKLRHSKRGEMALSRELYLINCNKCNKKILSAYSNKENKIIYCEKCYERQYL